MAHLEPFFIDCEEPDCKRRATVRLKDADYQDKGRFCDRHGRTHLQELGRQEERQNKRPTAEVRPIAK